MEKEYHEAMEETPSGPGEKTPKGRKASKSKKRYRHFIFRDWCKACRICAAFCPRQVIGWSDSGQPVIERPEECIGCRFCELHCPDFAISVKEEDEGGKEKTS